NLASIMRRQIGSIRLPFISEFWQRKYLPMERVVPDLFFPMWNPFLRNGRKVNLGSRKNLRSGFVSYPESGRHIRYMRGVMEKYLEVGPGHSCRPMIKVGLRLWFRKIVRSI